MVRPALSHFSVGHFRVRLCSCDVATKRGTKVRTVLGVGFAVAALLFVGCGSSDTATVTVTKEETVEAPTPSGSAESESAPSSATEGETPTATTIPDGTWTKDEYTPGTYRAAGGELCEWEQRQQLNQEANGTGTWGIGETNILAEIDSPYFLTENCGTWQKVG